MNRLMESNLSLIEITGEDDSLLEHSQADEIAAVNNNTYFSCSPLHIFRPPRAAEDSRLRPTADLKNNRDADKPTCSSREDVSNKENVHENKLGVTKLNVEPQQMKKRKKGGGYNLRKSLAWDQAFFTEEGVLNPLELSMVSGKFDALSGERMSVIKEEETNSVHDDLDCSNDSAELQALEEKLFKELPVSTSHGGKNTGECTQPMQESSTRNDETTAPAVMRKVLSVHDANRSGSKRGGFSRPLSSASRKRQANSITKVAPRDANLPKIPASKPDPCLLSTSTKSASLSMIHLMRNQIAQPGVIVPKSAGLKGSSSKFISSQNNAKLVSDCIPSSIKSSALHARRNMVSTPQANPSLEINSSANLQPQLVTKVKSGLEVIKDIELPTAPANREHPSTSGYSGSNKTTVSLPQNAQYIGGNLQYRQPQITKPSGLRMPSPSLGLFSQPKASTLQSQKNQTCNLLKSSVPNFQKLHASNSIRAPRPLWELGKTSRVVSDIQTGNITALTSSGRCSISSAAKPVLPEAVKLNFEVNSLDESKVKFSFAPRSSKVVKDSTIDCVDRKYHKHAEAHDIEIPRKEASELQIDDHKLLLQSASCKIYSSYISFQPNPVVQVRDVCEKYGTTENQFMEQTSVTDQHGSSESGSRNTINCTKAGSSVANDSQLVNMLDITEKSGGQVNLTKYCTHEPDRISLVENKKVTANDEILFQKSSFEESQNYANGHTVGTKVQGSSTSTLESCQLPSQYTKKSGKDAIGADEIITISHEQDAPTLCLNGNILVESCKKNLRTCSRYLMISDDLNEQSGEHKPQNPVVELSHVEIKPFMHEVKPDGEVASKEFDSSLRISNDQTICEITTLNSAITNFHPESRDSSGSELEGAHSKFLFSPEMQVKSVCRTEKMIEYQPTEELEYKSPVKNQAVNTNAQFVDTFDGTKEVASVLQNNQLSCMHITNESSEEQTQLIKCCSSGADQISNNENQKLQTEDNFSSKSSQKNDGCVTDVNPNISHYNVSKLESSHGPSQLKFMVQGKEGVSELESSDGPFQLKFMVQRKEEGSDMDSTTKKSSEEDAERQSIDGGLLVEECRSNLSCSAVQSLYSLGSDSINKQSSERMELRIPGLVVKLSSLDEHGLCLNNCSLVLTSASSDESREENDSESSDHVLQLLHRIPDDVDVKKMTKHLRTNNALPDTGDFNSSFEGHHHLPDTQLRHGLELNSQATILEYDSSLKLDKEESKDAVTSCRFQELHSSSNGSGLSFWQVESSPSGSIQQYVSHNDLESAILPEKAETKICQDDNSGSSKQQCQLDHAMCYTEKDELIPREKSENDTKRDDAVIKPPLGAVPFSDEWLTAIEAAGEEILTLKSGAVQNSPPDKSLPEPGPWSPVRKKANQEIGPFDCTKKFTTILPADSN